MTAGKMKYTLVIAAYNEADNIGLLTSRIIATLDAVPNLAWKLIYVIEGTDETRSIAQTFADRRSNLQIIYNAEPSGLGNAFRKGFDAVPPDSDVVITMDADLNHQPEEMPRLVDALYNKKADIVVGSRKTKGSVVEGGPYWKKLLSDWVNTAMRKIIGMPIVDQTSGYRVYSYSAFRRISFENPGFAFLPEILLQAHSLKMNMVEEPIQFIFRKAGVSKMKLIPTAKSYLAMLGSRFRNRR